ncbi:hypothetical protein LP420_25600 [Massilia sp. B-10]|nr:hypothetical protein LP420_25600 [Massilia sp. B-10]
MLKMACRSAQIVLLALAAAGHVQAQAPAQLTPPPAPAASEIKQQSDPKPSPVPQVEIKAPAPSTAPGAPKGTLVIIGGGLRGENEPVWERIVELALGKGARIAVFGTASASPERAARLDAERLNFYGADAFVVPVAVRLKGTDYRAAANDPVLAAQVSSAAWRLLRRRRPGPHHRSAAQAGRQQQPHARCAVGHVPARRRDRLAPAAKRPS